MSLTVLVLGAINYAHLVNMGDRTLPQHSGLGRIGRDLSRRAEGDDISLARCEFRANNS